jgi:hypothetical protein
MDAPPDSRGQFAQAVQETATDLDRGQAREQTSRRWLVAVAGIDVAQPQRLLVVARA